MFNLHSKFSLGFNIGNLFAAHVGITGAEHQVEILFWVLSGFLYCKFKAP